MLQLKFSISFYLKIEEIQEQLSTYLCQVNVGMEDDWQFYISTAL